jgi:hypothetical protein
MDIFRIPVVRIGGGYLKAILLNGQETVWGRDEKELAGRLKRVPRASPMHRAGAGYLQGGSDGNGR